MAGTFIEVQLPQQKLHTTQNNTTVFPLILSPNKTSNISFTNAIKSNKQWLEARLHSAGAVLFRGFPVATANDFNDVVEAFGFEELPYVGGAAARTHVVGRVFTANDSPPDKKIHFHHEMAMLPVFPSKLFFFCEMEPKSGGETPIVLSHIIYERMKEKHPEFVQKLEVQGLIYTKVTSKDDDPTSLAGRGWKSTYSTEDKSIAEERAAKFGVKLEWLEDGGVKQITSPMPAIKFDVSRQRHVWFNSMVLVYTSWVNERNDPAKNVTFGDGTPLPSHVVFDCINIMEEESVAIPWQKGDVLLIDNSTMLHSRRSYEPPRRVLASLCK